MRSTIVRWSLLLVGLLFLSATCCSPGVTIPRNTIPTDFTQALRASDTTAFVPTMTVSKEVFTLASTNSPSAGAETTKEEETSMPLAEPLTITILYDNNVFDERLKPSWGFSALVEYRNHTLLFDTGGDGPTLLHNMRILGIEPTQIESVVLSHAHGDHTGGLGDLLQTGVKPTVFLLPSYTDSFKRQVAQETTMFEVMPGRLLAEGIYTTGEMGRSIPEQALVIQTRQGLVVITGCAHPGIVEVVEQALRLFRGPVKMVLGGFHLGSKSKIEINDILRDFRRLGVEQVAPCHCTGALAIAMFADEYGEDFLQAGVGRVIKFR